jgi:hypothetical protein
MFLKIWRFLTILMAALSMSLSVCHPFEMPQRMKFDAKLWTDVTVFGNVFHYFGSIGAALEVNSILFSIALIFLVRKRGRAIYYLTLGGAVCLILALANWFLFVSTANAEFARWLTNPIPPDFESWRRQWEYGHAANAFIKITGFGLLLFSVIVETPKTMIVEDTK